MASARPPVASSSNEVMTWSDRDPKAPAVNDAVLDPLIESMSWNGDQKQRHMQWHTILNTHITRGSEIGEQICGRPVSLNFNHEWNDNE